MRIRVSRGGLFREERGIKLLERRTDLDDVFDPLSILRCNQTKLLPNAVQHGVSQEVT